MKKFIASTLEAAQAKARRAFGDKAVIVSVRNLPSGDVEVQASDKPKPNAPQARRMEPVFGDAPRAALDEVATKPAAGLRLNERIEQRFSEDALSKLKGELSTRGGKTAGAALDLTDKTVQGIADLLRPHGVGDALLSALIAGARQSKIAEDLYRLEVAFAEAFTFAPLNFAAATPVMLVGPTGAGKTSCSAKLASTAMTDHGSALIMSADAGRAGAIDQLRTYGENLGADYFIVEAPYDVEEAMKLKRPTGAVLLDTPGVSPFDSGDIAALQSFREACGGEAVLVLPATGDAEEFKEWALAFKDLGVKRCIITKFDAAKRVGAALNAAHAAGMTLAHFSESAFISEGLLPATPEFLARRFLASRPGKIG